MNDADGWPIRRLNQFVFTEDRWATTSWPTQIVVTCLFCGGVRACPLS